MTQQNPKRPATFFLSIAGLCLGALLLVMPADTVFAQSPTLFDGIPFIQVQPGTFTMGSNAYDEKPPHQVTISKGFYIGEYEITQSQWVAVMGTHPWLNSDNTPKPYVQATTGNNPAVYISWNDVQNFIDTLNATAGAVYYRLPTEAEWEYACRAGTTAERFFNTATYTLENFAWYRDDISPDQQWAQMVGQKLANPLGLYDIYGNVWEWCQDWYGMDYYSISPTTDPTGPANGQGKVVRGGSFMKDESWCTSTRRWVYAPSNDQQFDVGFRLVRMLAPAGGGGGNNTGGTTPDSSSSGGGGGGCFVSAVGTGR